MTKKQIYHKLKFIIEPIHSHEDQMMEIASWIESEFDYNPKKILELPTCRTCNNTGEIKNFKGEFIRICPHHF